MDISNLINRKNYNDSLSPSEISYIVACVTDKKISKKQLAELCKAIYSNSMSLSEVCHLTNAMSKSGKCFDWNLDGPVVDKHSTGGVGDLVSLVLAPILAACGCYVPMISGRSLGHTGGTIDKLQSIPGFCLQPDLQTFIGCVESTGAAIVEQSDWCAPADAAIYAMRNSINTVDSLSLIVSSILSKKLAEGLDALVLDIKVGNGAWFLNKEEAAPLKELLIAVANKLELHTQCHYSDMNSPISYSVGNGLEVLEAINFLKNESRNSRLLNLIRELGGKALVSSSLYEDKLKAVDAINKVLNSGAAAERFARMISFLGGPADLLESPYSHIQGAPVTKAVFSSKSGYIESYNMRVLGELNHKLSRVAFYTNDYKLDLSTGLSALLPTGTFVEKDTPLLFIHARSDEDWQAAKNVLLSSGIKIRSFEGASESQALPVTDEAFL